MSQALGTASRLRHTNEALGPWPWLGPELAVVAIWAVNQWVEDLSSPAPGMLSFRINEMVLSQARSYIRLTGLFGGKHPHINLDI